MRQKNTPREDVANRKTTTLERVKPLTLGDLAKSGVERIEAECEWCRRAAQPEIALLIAREPAALFRDIVRRLRCSVCGWNRVEAWPIRPGREIQRRHPSALPPLAECRALLAAVPIDPKAQRVDQRAAMIQVLRERWPELTASAALFVVQAISDAEHKSAVGT